MFISARERVILQILLHDDREDEITIKGIADNLHVSERTIHRDLKNVEDILASYHLQLTKKAGVGIKIVGEPSDIYQLRVSVLKQDFIEYTPDERLIVALCMLLDQVDPIKLFSLAKELGVTTATVSNDLDKLEPMIQKYNLTLVRKRGYGIKLVGSEEGKRKVIRSLISERFDVPEFLKMIRDNIQMKSTNKVDSISERLLGLVKKEKLLLIENIIEDINERLPYPLADSSYVGLVVHIALAMERIERGEKIALQDEYLMELKQKQEFDFATEIAVGLNQTFDMLIPEEEIGYITMHLRGAKIRYDHKVGIHNENVEVAMLVKTLILNVEKRLTMQFTDESLFQGLVAHLRPTLYRLHQKMRISNPLLAKIKKDYAELFKIVKKAAEQTLVNLEIPEEEIGYLVLHFGSAINHKRVNKKLRLLIICSSGIGTSKMLATKIMNQIPDLIEVRTTSVFELKNITIEDYDAILSTIILEDIGREYLLVNPILTDRDLQEVKAFLQQKTGQDIQEGIQDASYDNQEFTLDYHHFQALSDSLPILKMLLDEMYIWNQSKTEEMEDGIKKGLKELQQKGFIISEEDVFEALIERGKKGGLAIPETALALYHTSHDHITVPSFNILELGNKVEIPSMNGKKEKVKRILLMLAPLQADRNTMEVLSFLSALIIQSIKSMELFKSGSKKELVHFISNHFLNQYIQQKQEGTK